MATKRQTANRKNHLPARVDEAPADTSELVDSTLEDTLHSADWMAEYQRLYMQAATGMGSALAAGLSELQAARTPKQFFLAEAGLLNQLLETSATELFALTQQLIDWQLLLHGQLVKLTLMPKE